MLGGVVIPVYPSADGKCHGGDTAQAVIPAPCKSLVQDRQTVPGVQTPQPAGDVEAVCVGLAREGLPPCRALRPGDTSSYALGWMALGLAAIWGWKPAR